MEEKINGLIEELQEEWSLLQDLIDSNIKVKDYRLAFEQQIRAGTIKSCLNKLYSILNSENPNSGSNQAG